MNMDGVLVGGTEYIVAAYAIVWGGLFAYGISLMFRVKKSEQEKAS
jgi:hypothetical protein